jgi:hypothetical protein
MKKFLVVLILFTITVPATAQWLDRPWPDIPRTVDGEPDLTAPAPRGLDDKPDFTGIWNGPPPVARLDPTNLQLWISELATQRQQDFYKERPLFRCLPNGPETESFAGWKRFIQTPASIVILNENLTYRLIHMDGRELEANPITSWSGYSVGHWDGDTLVIDTFGFNDKTWVSRFGVSHTEALRVNERYRRPDFGHMQVEVTFTDPDAFATPWGFDMNMIVQADTEMLESVCERGSEDWSGSFSAIEAKRVFVSPETLVQYVGVYSGIYGGGERVYEISLIGGELIATIVSAYSALGLGAAGLEEGAPRTLVPFSETLFDGLGLGYRFIVNDDGEVESFIISHVSGDYTYSRLPL